MRRYAVLNQVVLKMFCDDDYENLYVLTEQRSGKLRKQH